LSRKSKLPKPKLTEPKLTHAESIALLRHWLGLIDSAIAALEQLELLRRPQRDVKQGRKAKTARRVR
jgi:hypothetical protein